MTRYLLALIVGTLALVPGAVSAEESAPQETARPVLNQVYVKLLMPTDSAEREGKPPVVESWIAGDLKKRGQAKFIAVTGWVPLDLAPLEATDVWRGSLGGRSYCPVGADIFDRSNGHLKILLSGWHPGGAHVTVSLTNEPGSRAIVAVKQFKMKQGMPYVAVFVGPPVGKHAVPTEGKK